MSDKFVALVQYWTHKESVGYKISCRERVHVLFKDHVWYP
jgi:hypothetical protein